MLSSLAVCLICSSSSSLEILSYTFSSVPSSFYHAVVFNLGRSNKFEEFIVSPILIIRGGRDTKDGWTRNLLTSCLVYRIVLKLALLLLFGIYRLGRCFDNLRWAAITRKWDSQNWPCCSLVLAFLESGRDFKCGCRLLLPRTMWSFNHLKRESSKVQIQGIRKTVQLIKWSSSKS